MKKTLVAVAALGVIALTGCSGGASSVYSDTVDLPNGGKVVCVFAYDNTNGSNAVSCDWAGKS